MKRIGYDSDTQKYTFKDQNGDLWEGPEGAEFGELTKGMSKLSSLNIIHYLKKPSPSWSEWPLFK